MFCIYVKTDSEFFQLQHNLIGLYIMELTFYNQWYYTHNQLNIQKQ